jgi:phospholipid transport system substrate-binding protein
VSSARRIALFVLGLTLSSVAAGAASAGPATDALQPTIDQVVHILRDPALKGAAKTGERRAALRAVIERTIDFPEAARRALGVHWQARSNRERDEFVALFKDMAMYSYVATLDGYAGQTVVIVGETPQDGVATVLTKIESRQGAPIPVDYRMHQRGSRWLVYDIVVEGVSLVGNYRAQFNTIVRTASYAELIRRMRARVAELAGPVTASAPNGPLGVYLALTPQTTQRRSTP